MAAEEKRKGQWPAGQRAKQQSGSAHRGLCPTTQRLPPTSTSLAQLRTRGRPLCRAMGVACILSLRWVLRGSGESPVTVGRNYPQPQRLGLPLLDQTSPHTPASLASLPQFFQNSLLLLKYQELQFNCPDHCPPPPCSSPLAAPRAPPPLQEGLCSSSSFLYLFGNWGTHYFPPNP